MTTPTQDAIILSQSVERLTTELFAFVSKFMVLITQAATTFQRLAKADPEKAYSTVRDKMHAMLDAEFERLADVQKWSFVTRQSRRRLLLPAIKDAADDYLKRFLDEVA